MELYHDSESRFYRTFSGGAKAGESILIRLKCSDMNARAFLRLWWQDAEQKIEMTAKDGVFEANVTLPDQTGVMWYFFVVESDGKSTYYGNARDGLDGVGEQSDFQPKGYQITIYDGDYKTPEWMRDGIMYQIMPDRFFASKPLEQRHKPYKGWLHGDWYEPVALSEGEANDFFGGDLKGIEQKLDYLQNLGVSVIYLNPVFRARSNHKYDTGDYTQIDPSFGTNDDFTSLCESAKSRGMRVMLDGVFSHTGAVSRYFNIDGSYDDVGAYQSQISKYSGWYTFKSWPDDYDCWWGFKTLPNVNEMSEGFREYILSPDGIAAKWLEMGASGWRLDVADELPMEFIRLMRQRVKNVDNDAAILGEVWEDASNKLSYGKMRSYCLGDTLDSVMNYPLREICIGFMLFDIDSARFKRRFAHMRNAYPAPFFYSLMNLLGSHDKPRIFDVLSGDIDIEPAREHRRYTTLSPEKYALARSRYIAVWRFLCSLPGMPCVYYGDEAGMTGMADPFCRGTYPWGREDAELVKIIADINRERESLIEMKRGDVRLYAPHPEVLVSARFIKNGVDALGDVCECGASVCALNRSNAPVEIEIAPDDVLKNGLKLKLEPVSSLTARI